MLYETFHHYYTIQLILNHLITELLQFLLTYSLLLSDSELIEWCNNGEIFHTAQEGIPIKIINDKK